MVNTLLKACNKFFIEDY